MSRIAASLALLVLSPLLAVLALAVRVDLGAPVLFRQTRAGRGGRPFTMVKLRTMNERRDAHGELLPDEQRVTALGRFLRGSRLDELPGLVNIALGDMSFIGPRPLLPETIQALGDEGEARCSIRPGLTGWAQVNGNTRLTVREKITLDLWYIRNRSLLLDLRILVRTLAVSVLGERFTQRSVREATR